MNVKEQIVLAAERLFAEHGLNGVSLRQISAAAGNGNNTAVQYHFGSKERLVQAIFEYRLSGLNARRRELVEQRRPDDLRSWIECHLAPILELGEQPGSHYLSFVAKLQQHRRRDVFDRLPAEAQEITLLFRERVGALLPDLPEPLRSHRIAHATAFSVQVGSEREQSRANDERVLPFAVHLADLLDGLIGFLRAPVGGETLAALAEAGADAGADQAADRREPALPLHP